VQECGQKITSEVSIYRCRHVGRRTNTKSRMLLRKHPVQRSSVNSVHECARIWAEDIEQTTMLLEHGCKRCNNMGIRYPADKYPPYESPLKKVRKRVSGRKSSLCISCRLQSEKGA